MDLAGRLPYRKRGARTRHWLSMYAGKRLNDYLTRDEMPLLHAHSKDAAQEGFYKACKTAKANREKDAKYPHKRKWYRTTIWKQSGIRRRGERLLLARAKGQPAIIIPLPIHLRDVLRFLEVRLVYDKRARRYTWHLVVENGKQPKDAAGTNVVAVDLGEIHPAVIGDEHTATIITCRERRHEQQGHAKRLAKLSRALSRKQKGSRRHKWWARSTSSLGFAMANRARSRLLPLSSIVCRTICGLCVDAGTPASQHWL